MVEGATTYPVKHRKEKQLFDSHCWMTPDCIPACSRDSRALYDQVVSWLLTPLMSQPSHSITSSDWKQVLSVTVARPRRICTVFRAWSHYVDPRPLKNRSNGKGKYRSIWGHIFGNFTTDYQKKYTVTWSLLLFSLSGRMSNDEKEGLFLERIKRWVAKGLGTFSYPIY